jgi:acyl transferase domain-containing protein
MLEPIAIIGLAGRFPGAWNLDELWANLLDGADTITRLSDEQLLAAGVPTAALADPAYVRASPLLPGHDLFDAGLFGFTPREAEVRDPQQRVFLEVAHAALENAGYDPAGVPGATAVFGGTGTNHYAELNIRSDPRRAERIGETAINIGNCPDYLATTVSYRLGLRGPAYTLATACSTSLVAVHVACQSLRAGECDTALAGGCELELPAGTGYRWINGGVRSRDGRCRPFDAAASGTVFGSGAGVVVLKRLSDAVADGDPIRAVVRGSAINNDGSEKVSFGAPSMTGQVGVITEAMTVAGIGPETIGYIEAHGTATQLGDPIELASLARAYRLLAQRELPPGSCLVGSVKSNVGHLGTAAGVTGLIKAVLALEHGEVPPTAHFTEPNPRLELDATPFVVTDHRRPWPRPEGPPRFAAVSSFGVGGTNAHVVLEQAPARPPLPVAARPRLVVWSASEQPAAEALGASLARHLDAAGDEEFADAVATLQAARAGHPVRAAVVAAGAREAAEAMAGQSARPGRGQPDAARPVAFLFPGQGAQQPRMAAGLYGSEPAFTAAADECLELLAADGVDLRQVWLEGDDDGRLDGTAHAQPMLFTVEYALARLWAAWGVHPTVMVGHSVGELVAATVGGVFGLPHASRLVAARGRAMQAMPTGGMLAVAAPEEALTDLLDDQVALAAVNGPGQAVLSGPLVALERVEEELRRRDLPSQRLRTSHAFHSPAMAPAVDEFAAAFEGVELHAPTVPVVSAATGLPLTEQDARSPHFWARQLVEPVRFGAALDTLLDPGREGGDRGRLLIEVGPAQHLTGLARRHPEVAGGRSTVVPTLPRSAGDSDQDARTALAALGQVWVEGHPVDWAALRHDRPLRRVALPGYPYQRQRFWLDQPAGRGQPAPTSAVPEAGDAAVATAPAAVPAAAASPFSLRSWVEVPQPAAAAPGEGGSALVLVPPDRAWARMATAAVQRAGWRVVAVRAAATPGARSDGFGIRPGQPDDLDQVLAVLADRGESPSLLVHAWTLGDAGEPTSGNLEERLELGVHGLLALIQRGTRRPASGVAPPVLVLTSRSADVSGVEPVDPDRAALHGLMHTLTAEAGLRAGRLVDIGAAGADPTGELADELAAARDDVVVAVRGGRRWVARELPFAPAPAGRPALRPGGTYLITGGLGGLGLAVAKGLTGTGLQPNLVLLGRHGTPEGDDRARLAADGDGPEARLCRDLEELESLGATVRVLACDVADRRALRRALDVASAQFGPLHGVVHAAGVAGGGLLHLRGREDADAVLRPKVLGTLLLEELLADRPPLDFFVSFSSRAGLGGLLGSGDYAAANAFLDAHAARSRLAGGRALSIAWPAWDEVGMAARAGRDAAGRPDPPAGPPEPADRSWERVLSAETHWVLDEHRIGANPVLPGTGVIDLTMDAFRETGHDDGPLRMREVVFREPLVASTPRRVRVAFEPAGEELRFRVRSRPETSADGDWTDHAAGVIGAAPVEHRTVDLEELAGRLPADPDALADRSTLFTLGPRWRCIDEVRVGDGELLVGLELPPAFRGDLAEHALHPALLDAATAIAQYREPGRRHLPFLYRELVAYAPIPATARSHVRRRPDAGGGLVADVDVVAPDGRVVVAVRGFTMRPIDADGLRRRLEGGAEPAGGDQPGNGQPAQAAPAAEAQAAPARGIAPGQGVRLLLELLAARRPPMVAVRPYVDGRPVPLTAGVPAPAPASRPLATPPSAAPAAPAEPAPAAAVAEPAAGEAGNGSLRAALHELWVEALGHPEVGEDDDFFDLGGNSLSAIQLMSNIQERFGVELSVAVLFERPTVSLIAESLEAQGAGAHAG